MKSAFCTRCATNHRSSIVYANEEGLCLICNARCEDLGNIWLTPQELKVVVERLHQAEERLLVAFGDAKP